jgi:hypothetical protein
MDLINAIPLPPMSLDLLLLALGLALSTTIFGITGAALTWNKAQGQRVALTPEQQRQRAEQQRQRELEKRLAAEERARLRRIKRVAMDLEKKIIAHLANAGFAYIYERKGTVARASKPTIGHVMFGADAIWFHITKLPFRIQYTDLLDPDVGRNLSLAVGRECKFISDVQLGLWVQVGLKSGISAVPKFFAWHDPENPKNALEMLPRTRPFNIAFGLGENRAFVHDDIRRFPHLLVAGASGGGKSVFLNQLLCTLIKNNSPQTLKLILIDLKGGIEFDAYSDIPHLQRSMIDRAEDIPAALAAVMAEKERRFTLLRKGKVKNLKMWNMTQPAKMPYWFIIFDEIAALMLDPKLKSEIETIVTNLAEQGRAVGIHLILCTQYPNKEVVTTRIKANITFKVAFASDDNGSMLLLGNLRAARMGARDGRCVFSTGLDRYELQAPFITDQQITEVIEGTKEPVIQHETTPEDLFTVAWQSFGGRFPVKMIYEAFEGSAPKAMVEKVAKTYQFDFEKKGPIIEIPAGRFILAPQEKGNQPRRLFAVNGVFPQTLAEIYGPGSVLPSVPPPDICGPNAAATGPDLDAIEEPPEEDDTVPRPASHENGGVEDGGESEFINKRVEALLANMEISSDGPEEEDDDDNDQYTLSDDDGDDDGHDDDDDFPSHDWSWNWGDDDD